MINPDIFREYDIRGIVDVDLTEETVYFLGRALSRYFQEKDAGTKVLVGRDNRLHSERLEQALVAGLSAGGSSVITLGTIITPGFYYARHHLNVDAGVMITGSHNPSDYNGFKIALGPGTIYGKEIQEVRVLVEEEIRKGRIEAVVRVEEVSVNEDYLEMLTRKIKLGPKELKVVVDCGNGTASLFAVEFLERLGVQVIPLYCDSDGNFPNHHPDPVKSENLVELSKVVRETGADIGVAYDGDADRIGVVSDKGEILWGDMLMILYWREILAKYPGADAIIEVKCSQALVDEVNRLGGKPFFYKTGHSLIKAKMKEIGALFTGEMSGHMFFSDEFYGFDDALYATGRVLRILSFSDISISEMLADVPQYYSTAETRIDCADQEKMQVVSDFRDKMKAKYPVIDIDGARVLFPAGWGLVRASNTQPAIVARCEASSKQELDRITKEMQEALLDYEAVQEFIWEY